jgi:hypothetical protein
VTTGQETTRLPVRSALFKQRTGGLVVRWVTTSEYPLLYVFVFFSHSTSLGGNRASCHCIRTRYGGTRDAPHLFDNLTFELPLENRGDCYRYNDSQVDNAAQVPSTYYLLDTIASAMYYRCSYSSESLVFCAWCRIMHEVVTNTKLDERERHLSRTLALISSSQLHLLEHHNV